MEMKIQKIEPQIDDQIELNCVMPGQKLGTIKAIVIGKRVFDGRRLVDTKVLSNGKRISFFLNQSNMPYKTSKGPEVKSFNITVYAKRDLVAAS